MRADIEETKKPATIVPFIYRGYRLYPVRRDDKEKYSSFLEKMRNENNDQDSEKLNIDSFMDYILTKYSGKENRGFFVFKDGELVGDVFVTGLDWGSRACVTTIGLLKEHRGKGIGKGLMATVETLAIDQRCTSIELLVLTSNSSVVDFYRKIGYCVRMQTEDGWSMVKDLLSLGRRNRNSC